MHGGGSSSHDTLYSSLDARIIFRARDQLGKLFCTSFCPNRARTCERTGEGGTEGGSGRRENSDDPED